jgi:hypothetical protein
MACARVKPMLSIIIMFSSEGSIAAAGAAGPLLVGAGRGASKSGGTSEDLEFARFTVNIVSWTKKGE